MTTQYEGSGSYTFTFNDGKSLTLSANQITELIDHFNTLYSDEYAEETDYLFSDIKAELSTIENCLSNIREYMQVPPSLNLSNEVQL